MHRGRVVSRGDDLVALVAFLEGTSRPVARWALALILRDLSEHGRGRHAVGA